MINLVKKSGYSDAIKKVIEVRESRRKKYGDSWRERKEYQLMGLVKEKADRLEYNFLNADGTYEGKKECLVDLINWSLFYLQLEIEKNEKL